MTIGGSDSMTIGGSDSMSTGAPVSLTVGALDTNMVGSNVGGGNTPGQPHKYASSERRTWSQTCLFAMLT